MKRTMYFKCSNCGKTAILNHEVKVLSKNHNDGKIFLDDDAKFIPHDCEPDNNSVRGVAYLMKVEEIDGEVKPEEPLTVPSDWKEI